MIYKWELRSFAAYNSNLNIFVGSELSTGFFKRYGERIYILVGFILIGHVALNEQ